MSKKECNCPGNHFRRRDFIRVGALSFLGIHLDQYLQAASVFSPEQKSGKQKAKACILVWLNGGASQMDTWDPKPTSSFKPIPTNVPGIQVSELFPKFAKHVDKVAIIRNMYVLENNHRQATHYAITGHRPSQTMRFPSLGSIVTKELGQLGELPPYVMTPDKGFVEFFSGHFLGAQYDPMVLPDPSQEDFEVPDLSLPSGLTVDRLENRRAFLEVVDHHYRETAARVEHAKMDSFREQAWKMILSDSVKKAFDLSQEPAKLRDTYGRTPFGQSCLLARRLIEGGSRFVTANGFTPNAWDTHGNNDTVMKDKLCPTLDQSLSALLDDMNQRGLLKSTIVLVMGEFGRTYDINSSGGRDHWAECWSLLLAGGGLRTGLTVGESDERGAYSTGGHTTMGDVYATIYKAMGIDWEKTYMHPIGRPLKIANSINDETGQPVKELI